MKKILSLAVGLGLLGAAAVPALAADGAGLYQSKACFSCHGADAKTPIMPIYPKLAGQNADYLYNQMVDIKSGARANGQSAVMKPLVATVTEEELRAIAEWLASL